MTKGCCCSIYLAPKNSDVQVHDRMTEQIYPLPLRSFKTEVLPMPTFSVPLLTQGRAALEEMNSELGLAFDEWDLDYYTKLFTQDVKRDPTNVELFDIAQSNSEHSRHWFFRYCCGDSPCKLLCLLSHAPCPCLGGPSTCQTCLAAGIHARSPSDL